VLYVLVDCRLRRTTRTNCRIYIYIYIYMSSSSNGRYIDCLSLTYATSGGSNKEGI
jgi:hypothetical protein